MLEFRPVDIKDYGWVSDIVGKQKKTGSDTAFANIYLLRDKYDIEICRFRDMLIRRYNGNKTRAGYTFPIGEGDVRRAVELIEENSLSRGISLEYALLTEEQKDMLEQLYPGEYIYECEQGDSDYVYSARELAQLPGKSFHKKKNHVSKFMRTYPDFYYEELGAGNWEDAATVADGWYYEHLQDEDASMLAEYRAIKEALMNYGELGLIGGVLYVNDAPCAMTMASYINEHTVDVHFEKVIGEAVGNGGYAMINNIFAKNLSGVEWINREEDIGIEGLRKAKMSYHPHYMIKKYHAVRKKD